MRVRELLAALLILLAPQAARAHPHVWVSAASEIMFDDKGRIAAIRHHWLFDEEFSAYALQGLDTNRDGKYSKEELEPLAKENVESLKDFDFFTFLNIGDYQAGFSAPKDYFLELLDKRLLLHFTLPLAVPVLTHAKAVLEIGDPEYYVAFSLPTTEAVRLDAAPTGCTLRVHPGEKPSAVIAAQLAEIGADQRQLPPEMQSLTAGTENTAEVDCGAPAAPPGTASGAIAAMEGSGHSGDLTALPAAPTSSSVAETTPGDAPAPVPASNSAAAEPPAPTAAVTSGRATPSAGGWLRRWTVWIGAIQTEFNRDLTAALKSLKDGGAFWWLASVSFLYGIVHAAGPGHGKVVISSYLLANEARLRRGVLIAFIASFVQAVVAVGLIGLLAVVLNLTSMAIDSTARTFEAGSFALVAALGIYLLLAKGRAAWAVLHGGDAHAHHHHHHHDHASPSPLWGGVRGGAAPASPHEDSAHDHQHSHAHQGAHLRHQKDLGDPSPSPSPQGGGGSIGMAGAAAAVLSVGIRPCTGALVVLVFALSQGVFWAGAASTFVMALGTAITVAVLAALAVGAKDVARRLARGDDRRAGQVMLGLELAAALAITVLGVVLFVGSLYAPGFSGSSIG